MSKKLGVTFGFLSAVGFFLGWYSFTWVLVFACFILLINEDEIVKKNVLSAIFLNIIFMAIELVLGKLSYWFISFLGDLASWSWVKWFTYDVYDIVSKFDIAGILNNIVRFVHFVLTVVFALIALKGNAVKVPVASGLADKVLGFAAPKAEKEEKKDSITSEEATLKDIPKE